MRLFIQKALNIHRHSKHLHQLLASQQYTAWAWQRRLFVPRCTEHPPLPVKPCFSHVHRSNHSCQFSTSALYIPHGDGQNVAIVEVDIMLDEILQDIETLEKQLAARKLSIDVQNLCCEYDKLCKLKEKQEKLEETRENVVHRMKHLVKQKNLGDNRLKQKLMAQGKKVREELKGIYAELWPQEERVMLSALRLPAPLLSDTPQENIILQELGDRPKFDFPALNHVELGQRNNMLHFSSLSPGAYYLLGDLARLELDLLMVVSTWLKTRGLLPFSSPDFAKTLVVEGCGEDFSDPQRVFSLQSTEASGGDLNSNDLEGKMDNTLHLVGGSSLASWAAYLAKMIVHTGNLPLQFYSVGRHYDPAALSQGDHEGLLRAPQSNRISFLAAGESEEKAMELFDEYQRHITDIYKEVKVPARLVRVSASELRTCETARVDLEMWMAGSERYVKVAEVALSSDYISRRLMIRHSRDLNDLHTRAYLHLVHGYAFDTARVLAAILENSQSEDGSLNLNISSNFKSRIDYKT